MNSSFSEIADGLADTGFAVADGFLPQDHLQALLQLDEFKSGMLQFRKAGIGKGEQHKINESIRGDFVQWIDPVVASPGIKNYLEKIRALMIFINENLFLSLKDFEAHLTRYPAGKGYHRHLDQFRKDDHRRLSVILYLNENWTDEHGGQLRMHIPGRPKDIYPLANRLVCFRSDQIEHEVLPAVRERLSITGWILDQYSDLKHL